MVPRPAVGWWKISYCKTRSTERAFCHMIWITREIIYVVPLKMTLFISVNNSVAVNKVVGLSGLQFQMQMKIFQRTLQILRM